MVRHEGANDRVVLALGQTRARVIQRLVEAIAAARAHLREPGEVARRGRRLDHRRERRRIRRHDDVLAEAALQPQPRHAEIRVLVCQFQVAGVVGGFRDAPGQAERRAIGHLPADDEAARLLEQAAGRRAHHQRRHQIFEHRSRPGDQRRAHADRRDGSARAGTSAGKECRPWRSPRSSPGAPRRRAGRSSSCRGGPPERDSRSTGACDPGRAETRIPSRRPWRAHSNSSAAKRRFSAWPVSAVWAASRP